MSTSIGETPAGDDLTSRSRGRCVSCIAALVIVLTYIGILSLVQIPSQYTDIATLDCGGQRRIVLSVDRPFGVEPLLYYRVCEAERELIPRTMANRPVEWCSYTEGTKSISALRYSCVRSADGSIVAVMCAEDPYSVVALHDYVTGESWPHDYAYYNSGDAFGRGTIRDGRRREQHVRERLEKDVPLISRHTLVRDRHVLMTKSTLDLSYSSIDDEDLARLGELENVRQIDLSGTAVSDGGLRFLGGLPNLEHLELSDTGITDAGVSHLTGLRKVSHLGMSYTGVTDRGLGELQVMGELSSVDVSNTRVTGGGVSRLARALPGAAICSGK